MLKGSTPPNGLVYGGWKNNTAVSTRTPSLSLLTYCCLLLRSLSNPIQPNGKYIKKDSLSLVFLFDLLSPLLSFGLLYVLLNDKKGSVYIYIYSNIYRRWDQQLFSRACSRQREERERVLFHALPSFLFPSSNSYLNCAEHPQRKEAPQMNSLILYTVHTGIISWGVCTPVHSFSNIFLFFTLQDDRQSFFFFSCSLYLTIYRLYSPLSLPPPLHFAIEDLYIY